MRSSSIRSQRISGRAFRHSKPRAIRCVSSGGEDRAHAQGYTVVGGQGTGTTIGGRGAGVRTRRSKWGKILFSVERLRSISEKILFRTGGTALGRGYTRNCAAAMVGSIPTRSHRLVDEADLTVRPTPVRPVSVAVVRQEVPGALGELAHTSGDAPGLLAVEAAHGTYAFQGEGLEAVGNLNADPSFGGHQTLRRSYTVERTTCQEEMQAIVTSDPESGVRCDGDAGADHD
jgi:hypothetical protein